MNKVFKTTSKVLANTFTILFGVITVGSSIALDNASAINGAFNIPVQKVVIDENAEIKSYYDSDYFDVEDLLFFVYQLSAGVSVSLLTFANDSTVSLT